jgi:GNAT superfamily N-acetyltransferase
VRIGDTAFAFRREPGDGPEERVWLLDAAGAIVGRCRTAPATAADADLGPRAAELHDLRVGHDPSRDDGLARRLLGHAVNDLLVRGYGPVFTWADAGDEAALAFLARHGLRADGARRGDRVRLVRQP